MEDKLKENADFEKTKKKKSSTLIVFPVTCKKNKTKTGIY